jgi:Peptidase M50B-like
VIVQSQLGTNFARINQVQPHLPAALALLLGLVALAAAAMPAVWRLTTHVNTIAHEGMHATMASALGWKVTGITMGRNGNGLTRANRNTAKSDTFLFLFVGYLGPSVFGLIAAKLIQVGHAIVVLWLAMLLIVSMLVMIRRSFGVITVIAAGVGLYLLLAYGTVGAQVTAAYLVAWFLLLSGIRAAGEVRRVKARTDADELRDLTQIPRGFWSLLWLLITLGAAGLGAVLLV